MAKMSDNSFPSILLTETTEPSAPAAGKQRLYIDSTTHVLMLTNSSGAESAVGAALGAWTTYTPTMTGGAGFNIGSSTLTGRYKLLDSKTLIISITFSVTTGGAWNAGAAGTNYAWALPAGVTTAARIQVGAAHVLDSGTAHFAGICKASASATTIAETVIADATGSRLLQSNNPIATLATGDQFNLGILLEIV